MSTPWPAGLPAEVRPDTVQTAHGPAPVLLAGPHPAQGGPRLALLVADPDADLPSLMAALAPSGRPVAGLDPRPPAVSLADGQAAGVPASAAHVREVADALSPQRVDLVGLGYGAVVAAHVVVDVPDRVATLALRPTLSQQPAGPSLALELDRYGEPLAVRPVPTLTAPPGPPQETAASLLQLWQLWDRVELRTEVRLADDTSQVPRARREVRQALTGLLPEEAVQDAELIASELVTNALLHACTPVLLQVVCRGGAVEIRVSDHGARTGAAGRPHHGRGLGIVAALATRHGTWVDERGRHVWAQLPIGSSPDSSAAQGAAASAAAAPSAQQTR